MKVNIISSGKNIECGINHYTTNLESALSVSYDRTGVKSYSLDIFHFIKETWSAIRSDAEVIHLQHEYNIFGPGSICSWPVILLLIMANVFTDKKIVITFHNIWDGDTFGPPLPNLKRFYIWVNNHLLLLAADHVFCLSDNVENGLVNQYDLKDYTRIPHGVQVDTAGLSEDEAREYLGWGGDSDIVIMPGYIREHKNYGAFVDIAREDKERKYIVAGGVRNEIFEEYAEQTLSDLPNNVEKTGILGDKEFRAVFAAADLCYLPYESASQSGNVNWAFAHGLPVFGSDIDYFRDLSSQTDGIMIVGSSPEAAVPEIERFFEDENLRQRMTTAALQFAEENSMENVAQTHKEVYKSLVE